jgi:hypothetical protein
VKEGNKMLWGEKGQIDVYESGSGMELGMHRGGRYPQFLYGIDIERVDEEPGSSLGGTIWHVTQGFGELEKGQATENYFQRPSKTRIG